MVRTYVNMLRYSLDAQKEPLLTRIRNFGKLREDEKELLNLNAEEPKALSIRNLSKIFPKGKRALQNISLQASEGSVLVLLGPNGAGKTTLLNILCGLTSATSGSASITGYGVQTDMDAIRRSLGVCLQNDVYWPDLTAREHLHIFCGLKYTVRNIQEEVENKLEEVQLTKVGNKEVSTFSGGMRRRLSIAMCMIGEPSIIFLDEPTTGIDVINQKYVWNIINSRKRKVKLMIIVTHSHEEALRSGDKIVVLADGKIQQEGTPQEIKRAMGNTKTLHILVDVSRSAEIKSAIARILPDAKIAAENAGSIVYAIPHSDTISRRELFAFLQKEQDIKDWKFSTAAEITLLQ